MKIILYVKIINIAIYLECSMKYALSLPWNLTSFLVTLLKGGG